MTNPAIEMARQRAINDGANGVTTSPVRSPSPFRQSPTDWGSLRGPSDPNSDGGISTVSLPPLPNTDFDDGGFGAESHPANEPFKGMLTRPKNELTSDEQELLYDHLVEKERARQAERDALAYENEKFEIHKKRTTFDLVKKFVVGFGVLAAFSFTVLVGLLIWVSVKKTEFNDTTVISSILNTFSTFFQILANL